MAHEEATGTVHPGWNWGPFTFRVPFYHTRIEWPELSQGILVAGATGLGLVPILQAYFGLSFDEAVACIFIQAVLLSSAPILFGEPYAPGWVTPALPLALAFVLTPNYPTPVEKFQVMTAVSIWFAILVAILGFTGLGKLLIQKIPPALKGGIILGAAIAALKRVFIDDADRFLHVQPIATLTAVGLCLLLTFSLPLQTLKHKYKPILIFAGLGLLPGFVIAAIVGPLVGEIQYDIKWTQEGSFGPILIPPFMDMWEKATPFEIGWPPLSMFFDLDVIILAVMGYVILFGDLITGNAVIKAAQPARPEEKIDINNDRSHYALAIRNFVMAIFAPFFPTQGTLWAGVHVIIIERWKEGPKQMQSLHSGIASYYVFGVPLLYLVLPLVTGLQPLMGIALSLTLVLTGFACAYVAMGITTHPIERGVALLTAVTLALFANQPWIGMVVGIVSTILLVGFTSPAEVPTMKNGDDKKTSSS
jgi:hypothetical protein